ncbi:MULTISPECIES: (Fe-S)-binding protein [Lichenihabitans]|uniref:(Fe-S)-binding protein n=1 Tax=Lichenihabitans TaxID=2723776 RepID=UPI001035F3E5|nr:MULTISPECIES: (Fe-S)-binding protein [Lichenihabitans]UDL93574.1 (Fe-S)-binding protein [Lichenihabitans sp. PAMC28606]
MKVSLFISCFNDMLFPQTGRAVVSVLERLGHEVAFPLEQTCCGQMHNNSGYGPEATALMRRFADVFADAETIVCPSSSCVVTVRVAYPRLAAATGDQQLIARIADLGARTFEFAEFLVKKLGIEDVGAYYPHRVTYHSTCNSLRGLGLGDAATRLLSHVRGLDFVELPRADECCGFGGTFAIKNADTSIAMLTDKLAAIRGTQAEICTAVDNSCLMHIAGGLSRERSGRRTLHLAEILASVEGGVAA